MGLGVLAHLPRRTHSFDCSVVPPRFLSALDLSRLLLYFIVLSLAKVVLLRVDAQILVNGQVFTDGLAIVDSPAPNTPVQSGSTLAIAIDVSGDGQLSQAAQVPGSSLPTRFEDLQIFLISYDTNINITVSTGTGLLTQESGSTVKHLSWTVPQCTPSGQYNLTLYENSVINNQPYFSITPIPMSVSGTSSGQCIDVNQLLPYPQASSPPSQNPFLQCSTGSYSSCTTVAVGTSYGGATSTPSAPSVSSSGNRGTTPGSSGGIVTVTVGGAPTTVTVVVVTTETLVETVSGQVTTTTWVVASYFSCPFSELTLPPSLSVTTSSMSLTTMTPTASGNFVGYIPVNGALSISPRTCVYLMPGCITLLTLFLRLILC
ncbi:hypothetical protein HYDPIDRAFT_81499 [Hydnomerulius pinastri MD-312]|nr:hypothetical protein HYDPIDRAFT_81499 [Hydnomerulius pinastri MD-312]